MAEDTDAESKTEEPTPRKLQQAREKGDVAKTPDLAPLGAGELGGAAEIVEIAGAVGPVAAPGCGRSNVGAAK